LITAIRYDHLAPKLDGLFHAYLSHRKTDESFLEFTRRHDIAALQSFCHQELV
jgi:ferredoxin-nitrite reductase